MCNNQPNLDYICLYNNTVIKYSCCDFSGERKKWFFRFILESKVLHFRDKETDTKPNLDF